MGHGRLPRASPEDAAAQVLGPSSTSGNADPAHVHPGPPEQVLAAIARAMADAPDVIDRGVLPDRSIASPPGSAITFVAKIENTGILSFQPAGGLYTILESGLYWIGFSYFDESGDSLVALYNNDGMLPGTYAGANTANTHVSRSTIVPLEVGDQIRLKNTNRSELVLKSLQIGGVGISNGQITFARVGPTPAP